MIGYSILSISGIYDGLILLSPYQVALLTQCTCSAEGVRRKLCPPLRLKLPHFSPFQVPPMDDSTHHTLQCQHAHDVPLYALKLR